MIKWPLYILKSMTFLVDAHAGGCYQNQKPLTQTVEYLHCPLIDPLAFS